MRLRNWIAVVVSVILLLAVGTIGIVVNRSALRVADTVHRADSLALGINNSTLAGQVQLLAASELNDLPTNYTLNLARGDNADTRTLVAFAAKTSFFRYGVTITDVTGVPLSSSRASGLPATDDPGFAPLRASLLAGQPGFSSIMTVDGVALEAVAVPITVGGAVAAVAVGFNEIAKTQLQAYTVKLSDENHRTTIVDSTGRVAATSDVSTLGALIEPELVPHLSGTGQRFVEFRDGGTKMIALVVNGMPGGWVYVRTQTMASFEGAVHSRNQTINLLLIAMLLIGVVGITILGYRTQTQRRLADERFQALFQHAPDLVAVLDLQGRIAYSSPSAGSVLNIEPGTLTGTSILDIVHPEDRALVQGQLAKVMTERDGILRMQCRVVAAPGGAVQWFDVTATNQMNNPSLRGVVVNARDVSENRAFQERLTHEAEHDPLTGLPNRRRMQDVLGSSLRNEPVAVLFVDLDGFKPVNDAHGHETGDELLRQVAERLSACVRENDVLARVGGDEFVVLMPGVINPADAEAMSDRFRVSINVPFTVGGVEVEIGASVGVHLATSADDPDQALRAADHAMYTVKRAGGSRRAVRTDDRRSGRHRREA